MFLAKGDPGNSFWDRNLLNMITSSLNSTKVPRFYRVSWVLRDRKVQKSEAGQTKPYKPCKANKTIRQKMCVYGLKPGVKFTHGFDLHPGANVFASWCFPNTNGATLNNITWSTWTTAQSCDFWIYCLDSNFKLKMIKNLMMKIKHTQIWCKDD